MKAITVIILSIVLLTNSLKTSFIYGWYALEIESFIETLCENTDKPEMQCNGKCFLTKVTASDSSENQPEAITINWDQLIFCELDVVVTSYILIELDRGNAIIYKQFLQSSFINVIFHPPRCTQYYLI